MLPRSSCKKKKQKTYGKQKKGRLYQDVYRIFKGCKFPLFLRFVQMPEVKGRTDDEY